MRSQSLVGVAVAVVAVAVVLGARVGRSPGPQSVVAGSGPGLIPAPVVGALRAPPAPAEQSDDALCSAYGRSSADSPGGALRDKPVGDPFMTAARQRLLVSQSPENLISVALLAREDDAQRMAATERAMSVGRDNAIVVWSAVQICDRVAEHPNCPAQDWETELQKLDSENSEVWIRLAASAYERGEIANALEALRRASTAAESRDYFPETVAMLERALDSAGGYAFPQRAMLAISFASANLPAYAPYVNMCSKQSLDAEWAQTCLDYGRLVERQGKTEIGIGIAQSIQFAALEAMGDAGAAEEVQARKASRARIREATDARFDFFIFGTPRLFADYLAAMREHGERAALAQSRIEANRLADLCSQARAH
ncbi:MAG: hypothetical protein ABI640_11800 [Gammaproteobacteria bacterium]